jgi:hypothetical protein
LDCTSPKIAGERVCGGCGPGRTIGVREVELVVRTRPMRAAVEATEPLMSQNGIPCRGTDEVLAVWNAKTPPIAAK